VSLAANLRNDKTIVLYLVSENSDNFQYTSESLKNDEDVVLAAVKQK